VALSIPHSSAIAFFVRLVSFPTVQGQIPVQAACSPAGHQRSANCEDVGVHPQPNGPAFDTVLILHVGCVVVGLATLVASATTAVRLRTTLQGGGALPEALVRYFRSGVNWVGRSIYGIPVFGFLLLALSHGAYSLREGWVMGGLLILVGTVLVAEGALWPAERRLQAALFSLRQGGGVSVGEEVLREARTMVLSATVALVLLVLGSALMVAQP
jgi:hypothetical protein